MIYQSIGKLIIVGMVLVSVSACQTARTQERAASKAHFNYEFDTWQQDNREEPREIDRQIEVVTSSLKKAVQQNPINCKGPNWRAASEAVSIMEGVAARRWTRVNSRAPLMRSNDIRRLNLNLHRQHVTGTLGASFIPANAALRSGCHNGADKVYRHIIQKYTGSAYTAQRERARLGIDDVREKRRNK
jgi:hypothetical protein